MTTIGNIQGDARLWLTWKAQQPDPSTLTLQPPLWSPEDAETLNPESLGTMVKIGIMVRSVITVRIIVLSAIMVPVVIVIVTKQS